MKATLEFNLDNSDDKIAHTRCVKSLDMALALWEIGTNLKKYSERVAEAQEADSDIHDGIYIVMQRVYEILEEHAINVEELIN